MDFAQNRPLPTQEEMLAVAVAYKNEKLIADMVLPRTPVGKSEYKYLSFPKGMSLNIVDDKLGRKSKSNQVDFKATESTGACEGHGLHDYVPVEDINDAPDGYDPIMQTVEMLTDLVYLNRERRVAASVFGAGNYATDNKATLTGSNQFTHADSHPIKLIANALDSCILRPNAMVFGRDSFSKLAYHPDVVKAVNRTAGDTGIATKRDIAALFEVDNVFVGEGWYNTAKKGQTVSLGRAWTDSLALIYQNKVASVRNPVTFGMTPQFGSWTITVIFDETIGVKGAYYVGVSESVDELIMANDLGYLFSDCNA